MVVYFPITLDVLHAVHVFARAGGGGSSGGSGGGLGLLAIGYLPVHYVTQWVYKRWGRQLAIVAGWCAVVACTIITALTVHSLTLIVLIGAIVGVFSGTQNWLRRLGKSISRTKKQLSISAAADPAWQEAGLLQHARQLFVQYQQDWAKADIASMQRYLAPHYFAHVRLMLMAMYEMGRRNAMDNVQILHTAVTEAIDAPDNDHDAFTVAFEAKADDKLVDGHTNEVLYADAGIFQELWHFDRQGNDWVIDGITQATQDVSRRSLAL
jgi:hypothetical protein